ncbi:MAG: hypothetical protein R3A51_08715 [Nannocystaceae bacterium]
MVAGCACPTPAEQDPAPARTKATPVEPTPEPAPVGPWLTEASQTLRSSNSVEVAGLARLPDGDIALAGLMRGDLEVNGALLTSAGGEDILVMRLAPDGSPRWARRFGGQSRQAATAIAVDPTGDIIVTGSYAHHFEIGETAIESAGHVDVFVTKLAPDGAPRWARSFGDRGRDHAEGLAVDARGELWLAGWFSGELSFGGAPLRSAGDLDAFVVRLGPDGDHRWSRAYGDDKAQLARTVVVDAAGSVYVAGEARGLVDFGGGPIAAISNNDVFALKLGPAAEHRWARRFAAGDKPRVRSSAASPAGVVIAGTYARNLELGEHTLRTRRDDAGFVTLLDLQGAPVWAVEPGATESRPLTPGAVAVGPTGAVYVAGDVILKRPDGASRLAYLTEINADGVAQDWPLPASSDSRAVAVVTLDERRALVVGNEFRGVVDPAPGRPVSEANLTTWLLARPE